jgi:hypothetical protein
VISITANIEAAVTFNKFVFKDKLASPITVNVPIDVLD